MFTEPKQASSPAALTPTPHEKITPYYNGDKSLEYSRVAGPLPAVDQPHKCPIVLVARVPSEECGCPEEHWRIEGFDYIMHLETDGTGDMFLFAGDFELEKNVPAATLADLRGNLFTWHAELMNSQE
jgi:hypothetical protein